MNILNIEEKKLSIIMPFKNGHTLLKITFIHLLTSISMHLMFNSIECWKYNTLHILKTITMQNILIQSLIIIHHGTEKLV